MRYEVCVPSVPDQPDHHDNYLIAIAKATFAIFLQRMNFEA
ncbi:hypothetical protein T07_3687 [Trichinella nelsoni]|uniref:Uncharacterized protein n=1 Tax=Trichinella nelsoni TaxID=6336 RepID=A0A0V0REE1_9BILA|nr:hypothetical protein T07_3687 [Trichinella nelsoni]